MEKEFIPYESYLLTDEEIEKVKHLEWCIRDRLKEEYGKELPEVLDSEINYIVSQTFIRTKEYYYERL